MLYTLRFLTDELQTPLSIAFLPRTKQWRSEPEWEQYPEQSDVFRLAAAAVGATRRATLERNVLPSTRGPPAKLPPSSMVRLACCVVAEKGEGRYGTADYGGEM